GLPQARHVKFFILGNHEQRLRHVAPLRAALTSAGFTDLGSKCIALGIHGVSVLIAGTERPWFGCDPPVETNPESQLPNPKSAAPAPSPHPPAPPFRLLLSHTPDPLSFAP